MKMIGAVLFILLCGRAAFSQEIQANVVVNMEMLTPDQKVFVSTIENDIRNYINNQRFTDVEWEGPRIPVEISLVLQGAGRGHFAARATFSAKRNISGEEGASSITMRIYDEQWEFDYNQGAALSYNQTRFNDVTTLIDYYMLIFIGFDMDTYEELSGDRVYAAAKRICNMGATINAPGYKVFSQPGEFTRYNLVSELTDLRYEALRKLFFAYFVDGLDMMVEDKAAGKNNLIAVIKSMVEFKQKKMVGPSVLLQAFFDSKAYELGEIFKGGGYDSVFQDLMYLDPSNTNIYLEAKSK